jgi:hypothetical protein
MSYSKRRLTHAPAATSKPQLPRQPNCLSSLSKDHGSLTAWNMIAGGDVVCRFEDGLFVRIGIDGRYFRTDRAALKKHNGTQGVVIAALCKRKGPLLAYMP